MSELQGGKFGHGFISAGLTKAANVNGIITADGGSADFARIVTAAVIGGTISEATGGKFANGAVTAAFAQGFNGNPSRKGEPKGGLPVYDGDDLVIDNSEAGQIFDFLWGEKRQDIGELTDLDRSFAQALYVDGIRSTKQLNFIADLWDSKGSIPKLGLKLGKRFFGNEDGKINITVKNILSSKFKPEYWHRAATGKYVAYGRDSQ
ncbi:MAG: hypothetical protein KUG79_09055 [Pseudomonadales bacterium]|nr:hypothetical protein [Pseudomonadales bacterium]